MQRNGALACMSCRKWQEENNETTAKKIEYVFCIVCWGTEHTSGNNNSNNTSA